MRRPLLLLAVLLAGSCSEDDQLSHCPVPDDPHVRYVAESYRNPRACEGVRFVCTEGEPFSNECGCGCLLP